MHPTFIQQASTEHRPYASPCNGCYHHSGHNKASHSCGAPSAGLGFRKDASRLLNGLARNTMQWAEFKTKIKDRFFDGCRSDK